MLDQNPPRFLRFAAAMMLWLGATACDTATPDDDVARTLPCNLDDDACAALPGAADALVLIESMDIDVDPADVELVEDASQLEAMADGPVSFDALTTEERPPEEQKFSCSGNDDWTCCCFWDGAVWGCGCI